MPGSLPPLIRNAEWAAVKLLLRTETGKWPASPRKGLYWGGRNGGRANSGEGASDIETFGGVVDIIGELRPLWLLLEVVEEFEMLELALWLLWAGGGVVTLSEPLKCIEWPWRSSPGSRLRKSGLGFDRFSGPSWSFAGVSLCFLPSLGVASHIGEWREDAGGLVVVLSWRGEGVDWWSEGVGLECAGGDKW